jgi:hypothetical protein
MESLFDAAIPKDSVPTHAYNKDCGTMKCGASDPWREDYSSKVMTAIYKTTWQNVQENSSHPLPSKKNHVGFEAVTVLLLNICIGWGVTPSLLV